VLSAVFLSVAALAADKFPSKPVHFVVGFAAGGPNDIVARVFGEWLSNHLGQQFVIENRVGSGGMIAANAVINSAADGYTIMFVAPNNAIGQTLYKNLPFVFLRDAAPVAGMMRLTNVMVVPPSLPVKTVPEFIAYAKANPGKLSYASSGNGTSVHMSAELFKMKAGLDMVHVPYRGSAAAYPDLLTGKVHVLFDNLPGSIEFVRAPAARARGDHREALDALPEVPSIAEIVPGYEASVWYGIAAPRNAGRVITALNSAFTARSPTGRSRRASPSWAARRCRCRRPSSAGWWRTRPRNGCGGEVRGPVGGVGSSLPGIARRRRALTRW
jgi:tripartite-type tricarboxylate transporter receptor subunit TctC